MMKIGDKVDKLTLVELCPKENNHQKGKFICDCGEPVEMLIQSVMIKSLTPKSCRDCKPRRAKTGGNKKISYGFDHEMANRFLMGKM